MAAWSRPVRVVGFEAQWKELNCADTNMTLDSILGMEDEPLPLPPQVKDEAARVNEGLLARPVTIADTGLRSSFLSDLALKTVYSAGDMTSNVPSK